MKTNHPAAEIREAMDALERNDDDRAAILLRLAVALASAREQHESDPAFGHWLVDQNLEMDPHNRAALIAMGREPEVTKRVLRKKRSISRRAASTLRRVTSMGSVP